MPNLTLSNEQVIELVKQLPEAQQQELFRFLIQRQWGNMEAITDYGSQQAKIVAAERGYDWDTMTEDEREEFIDELALTPPSPNTYPRTHHIPYSRTYTHRGWVPRESTQEKIGCRSPEVVGGQTRSKGLPTDPRAQPAGGRDNGPPRRLEFG